MNSTASSNQGRSATGEQAVAALVAFAAGDALGWPQEQNSRRSRQLDKTTPTLSFIEWTKRLGGRFQPHEETIGPGEYSDDTQLVLATARSLSHGNRWPEILSRQELPVWLLYERGGGRSTKRAAEGSTSTSPATQSPGDGARAMLTTARSSTIGRAASSGGMPRTSDGEETRYRTYCGG